ncbi:hypothetical protein FB45DRAFT_400120 [Roridomyces roridus]|uniref:ABC transporter domain-containing protein n=1 Tax=Roridomyces roridus TaxID=1738132 RepID=A0AAD7C3Q6_9AGAR|nr:hypothetical protein FB45DRAFT_400120 [Roridomyces roridus]
MASDPLPYPTIFDRTAGFRFLSINPNLIDYRSCGFESSLDYELHPEIDSTQLHRRFRAAWARETYTIHMLSISTTQESESVPSFSGSCSIPSILPNISEHCHGALDLARAPPCKWLCCKLFSLKLTESMFERCLFLEPPIVALGLDHQLTASALSNGQPRLLAIARAALVGNNLAIFDEATGNIDPHKDALIQQVIDDGAGHRASPGKYSRF